jgi:hypothetical protein
MQILPEAHAKFHHSRPISQEPHMPETPRRSPPDPQSPTRGAEEKARLGTRILPVPDESPVVAGMPRRGRGISDPGDPGIPRPEDDVYANDPADLSEKRAEKNKSKPE